VHRPRILLVVDTLGVGGAERHVVDLACAMRRRGQDVLVACSAAGPLAAPLSEAGVELRAVARAPVKRAVSADYAEGLRALLDERSFDVVDAHLFASQAASVRAMPHDGPALVVTEQTEAPWRDAAARRVSAGVYDAAACVVGVSGAIGRLVEEAFGVSAERVRVVPNAVVPAEAGVDLERPLPVGEDAPLVGQVARLAPEKGVAVLLEAAASVLERRPDARFLVGGDGPDRDELEARARRLGVDGRVHFLGWRADVPALLRRLAVLAVPSISEGTPLVILEAMHAGVPVVATTVGGIPEQIRHGREGLLVAPRDAGALADAIATLLDDRPLARRLAAGARGRARSAFGFGRMLAGVLDAYELALARQAAGRSGGAGHLARV
jgi:glycosyltransferase involved in cell wall biosynthesis